MKDTISENIALLVDEAESYIEAKAELYKLKAADRITEISTTIIVKLLFVLIGLIVIVAVNIGIALLIGKWMGQSYYGFFIIAGFYLLLGIIMYFLKDKFIKKPLYTLVIKKILK